MYSTCIAPTPARSSAMHRASEVGREPRTTAAALEIVRVGL